jgi:hypothetical protein
LGTLINPGAFSPEKLRPAVVSIVAGKIHSMRTASLAPISAPIVSRATDTTVKLILGIILN